MNLTPTDNPGSTASRTSRRTRRMAIVGVLALVLVAGLLLVGAKANGARSGALTENINLTCERDTAKRFWLTLDNQYVVTRVSYLNPDNAYVQLKTLPENFAVSSLRSYIGLDFPTPSMFKVTWTNGVDYEDTVTC